MTFVGWFTIVAFAIVLTCWHCRSAPTWRRCTRASGFSCRPYSAGPERLLYRLINVDPDRQQDWKQYAKSLLIFSLAGWLFLYFILRTQDAFFVPHSLNPLGYHSAPANVTFNIGLVFLDEHELAVLQRRDDDDLPQPDDRADGAELALGRRRDRRGRRPRSAASSGAAARDIGNFWHDIVRTILYILVPLSIVRRTRDRLPGRDREPLRPTSPFTRSPASNRKSRWGPSRHRRRSRTSAQTAAVSSTSTRLTRSRTRPRSPTSS